MAIAFVKGKLTRDPFYKAPEGDGTAFFACSVKETYKKGNGEEVVAGYHDVVAFGDEAQELALLGQGDFLEVKASIRYRADARFGKLDKKGEKLEDAKKNPFTAQFVVMEILDSEIGDVDPEDDAFPDA